MLKLKNKKAAVLAFFILILIAIFFSAFPAQAADYDSPLYAGISKGETKCLPGGNCSLCEMIQVAVNFGIFLLGIAGAIALLFFVYGGFLMLISAGGEKIQKGKNVLVNSAIGLAIALMAYTLVTFAINAVTVGKGWTWEGNLSCAPMPSMSDDDPA